MKINHISTIALLMLKRVWNEKRALILIVFSPIIICTTFGYVVHKSPEKMNTIIAIDGFQKTLLDSETQQIVDEIDDYETKDGSNPFSVVARLDSRGEALQRLDEGKARAVVVLNQGNIGIQSTEIIVDVTEPSVSAQYEQEMPFIFKKYSNDLSTKQITEFLTKQKNMPSSIANRTASQIILPFEIIFQTNGWKKLKFFDFFASGVIVLVALGLPLLHSAVLITWDRSMGTLERIFASPYKKSEIILGKMLANSILAIITTILIIVTLKILFDITLGNIGLVLLIAVLAAINGVIFGLLISSLTYSEPESLLWAIMSLSIFMFIMTYMWPWETMHPVVKYISYAIPYTYGVQAMRHVNMVGAGFAEIWPNLLILIGFIVAQVSICIQVLRRQLI